MITVDEALEQLLALVSVLPEETVPLAEASGRVLARDMAAMRDQPPFDAAAMDGYAVRAEEARPGATFRVIGEAAAGHAYQAPLGPGEALRIFTGAPLVEGATRVVIQEDVSRDGDRIILGAVQDVKDNIRLAGCDFRKGQKMVAPRLLKPADIALLASMNIPVVPVRRKPRVALISTGDELVMPGGSPRADQIIASNSFGLKALLEDHGAKARLLPIAGDTVSSLQNVFALAEGVDLVVTIGGASVGDHDLVGRVAADLGLERAFYKVAMRPGKPLMAGRMGDKVMVGLPGNPVSSMVCGHVFLLPMLRVMLGLGAKPAARLHAPLATRLPANGSRVHFMRAKVTAEGLVVADQQDSSLLSVLSECDALVIRPIEAPPSPVGELAEYLPI